MTDPDELLRCYEESIRLRPEAAIRLRSNGATEYYYRGNARNLMGDLEDALQDFTEAVRLLSASDPTMLRRFTSGVLCERRKAT